MNLFNENQLPKLKQPDGFTVLQNGSSYNDLIDEEAELILQYNALLKKIHQLEGKEKPPNEQEVSKNQFLSTLTKIFKLFKNGLLYKQLQKEHHKLAANFNQVIAENYELIQEIQRLKAKKDK
ncbi:hypothetical protein [Lactococcus kimchii]|uniref:hypothetical protein n=1 Tax=Lactococcus sp. S-13 TaxID=2507158 RepID=UPI001022AF00|nr:hypothetical protein [Lactococcus sp. S-13]RZI47824.1 hypothetical protein EQJ87_11145 [Lactococcus sp. S-13]